MKCVSHLSFNGAEARDEKKKYWIVSTLKFGNMIEIALLAYQLFLTNAGNIKFINVYSCTFK